MEDYKVGENVRVSGEVEYGDNWYRVASDGIIVEKISEKETMVNIDSVDGDLNAVVIVENKYIQKI